MTSEAARAPHSLRAWGTLQCSQMHPGAAGVKVQPLEQMANILIERKVGGGWCVMAMYAASFSHAQEVGQGKMGLGRRWDIWKRSIEIRQKICCDQGVAWEQRGGGMENLEANTVIRACGMRVRRWLFPMPFPLYLSSYSKVFGYDIKEVMVQEDILVVVHCSGYYRFYSLPWILANCTTTIM